MLVPLLSAALLGGCALTPARVSVEAGEMQVRVAALDSRLRMSEDARITLSCQSSHRSGDPFKPHIRTSRAEVPVRVARRRDGRDDVFTLAWPAAELVHTERGGDCRLRLGWEGAREDGSGFSLGFGAEGRGDHTAALLAARADTSVGLSWAVRDISDEQTGQRLRRRCFETLTWTRGGGRIDGYTHEHRLHDGPAACEEAFVAAGDAACAPGEERMTALGGCCPSDQSAGAGEVCVASVDERCLEGPRAGGGCEMALGVVGEAPAARAHPVLGALRGVPAGAFTSQVQVYPYEDRRQRKVEIGVPFLMMRSEVTRAMWQEVMGEAPPAPTGCDDRCPVTDVTPAQVRGFVAALRARDGGDWRLPTADEWEWAARGGEEHPFAGAATPETVAWTAGAPLGPQPVCTKAPNGFDLCDLSGNVWELVRSERAPAGGGAGAFERRGGSWFAGAHQATVFGHHAVGPEQAHDGLGFRLVVSVGDDVSGISGG